MVDVSRVRLSGPLAPHAEGFADWLVQQGRPPSMVLFHVRRMAYVSRWMEARKIVADRAIESSMAEAFVESLPATRHLARLRPGAFVPTWEYLRAIGVLLPAAPKPMTSDIDRLLARYCQYLSTERGLVDTTIARNVALVRPFLVAVARGDGRLELEQLAPREVTKFVVDQAGSRPRSVPRMATALRSLLRFLQADGLTATGLVPAVPTVARRRLATLPKALPPQQVAALLASCDQDTVVGLRDFAILKLMSRLGLRTGEIARLQLEDIDWRRGEVAVTGKANRNERLPVPGDVGDAIVAYLRARPTTPARTVFVRTGAPYRRMSRNAVTNVAARAARRTGLGTLHGHRLRHSAATAMLHAGASLDEIGQVLRHRHVLTTTIYAKVDIAALRTVARPWPGAGRAAA